MAEPGDPNYRYSVNEYPTNGVQTEFELSFAGGYISRDYVKARYTDALGGVIYPAFEFIGDYQVSISPALASGGTIMFYRDTPSADPVVDFADGAIINEASLDINARQAVHLAAETRDIVGSIPSLDTLQSVQAALDFTVNRANQTGIQPLDTVEGLPDALNSKVSAATFDTANGSTIIKVKGPLPNEVFSNIYYNAIEVKHLRRWGVSPDNPASVNRLGLQRAIAAADKSELVFPEGAVKIDSAVSTAAGQNIYLTGRGCGVSRLLTTSLSADLVVFNMGFAQGGGVQGLTLGSDVAFGAKGSSGSALKVINSNDQFMCKDFEVVSYGTCINVVGSYQPSFKDFRLLFFSDKGVFIAPFTGGPTETVGSRWANAKVSNYGYTGTSPEAAIGFDIQQGSGEFFDTIDVQQAGIPFKIAPPAGSFARFLKFRTMLADTAFYEGWVFDGSAAPVFNIRLLDCWVSGAGGGAARPAGSTRGAGLLTKGAQLDDLTWIGGELRDNDCGGWDHQGGTHCRMIGASVTRNSRRLGFNNSYPGVRIHANVGSFALIGNDIGNFSKGVFDVEQAEGIYIEPGVSNDIRIEGNDLRSPGTGKVPLVNGSTSANGVIANNLPQQFPGTNVAKGQALTANSNGSVAANTTVYMGMSGASASALNAHMMVTDPGIISQFVVEVAGAPGAGQSFTYTVMVNDVATAMTGGISGGGSFRFQLPNLGVTVNAGDRISIRLVTSSGAAVTQHRWMLKIDP